MKHIKRFSTILSILAIIVVLSSCYKENYSTRNLSDYQRCIARNHPDEKAIFPDVTILSEQNCSFYDRYKWDGSNFPVSLTYLICQYTEELFQSEVERIRQTTAVYSETFFEYPAYIISLNYIGESEYVLIDSDRHRIYYVFFQTTEAIVDLPNDLRPLQIADNEVVKPPQNGTSTTP